jgi:hypothetical protein
MLLNIICSNRCHSNAEKSTVLVKALQSQITGLSSVFNLFASIFVLNAVSSQPSFQTKLAGPADKITVSEHGSKYVQNRAGLEM